MPTILQDLYEEVTNELKNFGKLMEIKMRLLLIY